VAINQLYPLDDVTSIRSIESLTLIHQWQKMINWLRI